MKKTILITTNFSFLDYKKMFSKKLNLIYAPAIKLLELKKLLVSTDGWICSPSPKYIINRKILKNAKKLKYIVTPSTGTNHIDISYCKTNHIKVFSLSNTNTVNNIYASSEFTFLLSMIMIKNFKLGVNNALNYKWRKNEDSFRGNEIENKKISIIGFGRIGRNLAKYFKSLKADIYAYDIEKKNIPKYVSFSKNLKKVMIDAKIVFVCLKLNKNTYKFANKDFFKLMNKNTIFINTSRGEIVDENELYKSLKDNKLYGAALDVLDSEHLINEKKKNKLIEYSKKNNNLIITPHMAGLTYESESKAGTFAINKINKLFK